MRLSYQFLNFSMSLVMRSYFDSICLAYFFRKNITFDPAICPLNFGPKARTQIVMGPLLNSLVSQICLVESADGRTIHTKLPGPYSCKWYFGHKWGTKTEILLAKGPVDLMKLWRPKFNLLYYGPGMAMITWPSPVQWIRLHSDC